MMKRWTWWWVILVVLAASRWLAAANTEITSSEAYFWLLGQQWEWASWAGPGGLSGLVTLLGDWFGANPLLLRAFGPLWVLLGSVGLWWWACQLRGPRLGFWLTLVWNVLPVVNASSLIFGPDLAASAWWIWALALTWKAAHATSARAAWWVSAGWITALGSLFSYAILLVPCGVLLFLILDWPLWPRLLWWKKSPSPSRRGKPPWIGLGALWLIVLPALALTGPILWHISTDWVAFAGQTWKSLTEFGGAKVPAALLSAFWESGGLVLLLLGLLVIGQILQAPSARETRWFLAMGLAPLVWFFSALWRGDSELALPLLLALPLPMVWLGSLLVDPPAELGTPRVLRRAWLRQAVLLTILVAALLTVGRPLWQPPTPEPQWAELGERVERLARIYQPAGTPPLFLVSDAADAAAGMGFFLLSRETGPRRDFPPVYVRESQNLASQFGLWPRYDQFVDAEEAELDPLFLEQQGVNPYLGRSAIYIGRESPMDLPQTISNGFLRVIPLEKITDPSGRTFFLYFCEDYQTAPL